MSLLEFLKKQGIDPKMGYIALAINETIVKRPHWPTLLLQEDDRIELIHAVQGG